MTHFKYQSTERGEVNFQPRVPFVHVHQDTRLESRRIYRVNHCKQRQNTIIAERSLAGVGDEDILGPDAPMSNWRFSGMEELKPESNILELFRHSGGVVIVNQRSPRSCWLGNIPCEA